MNRNNLGMNRYRDIRTKFGTSFVLGILFVGALKQK